MNMVIVVEIVVGIFVLAGVALYAVRDARRRRASLDQQSGPEDEREVQVHGNEPDATRQLSEVADRSE